jgi:hypothetical protein
LAIPGAAGEEMCAIVSGAKEIPSRSGVFGDAALFARTGYGDDSFTRMQQPGKCHLCRCDTRLFTTFFAGTATRILVNMKSIEPL